MTAGWMSWLLWERMLYLFQRRSAPSQRESQRLAARPSSTRAPPSPSAQLLTSTLGASTEQRGEVSQADTPQKTPHATSPAAPLPARHKQTFNALTSTPSNENKRSRTPFVFRLETGNKYDLGRLRCVTSEAAVRRSGESRPGVTFSVQRLGTTAGSINAIIKCPH